MVAMSVNVHELPEFVRLAHRIGADEITVQKFVPEVAAPVAQGWIVDIKEEQRFYYEAKELATQLGVKISNHCEEEVANV